MSPPQTLAPSGPPPPVTAPCHHPRTACESSFPLPRRSQQPQGTRTCRPGPTPGSGPAPPTEAARTIPSPPSLPLAQPSLHPAGLLPLHPGAHCTEHTRPALWAPPAWRTELGGVPVREKAGRARGFPRVLLELSGHRGPEEVRQRQAAASLTLRTRRQPGARRRGR